MEKLFIGVDLGTSALKLVLIDESKKIVHQISEVYDAERPDSGWNEIDPEIWFASMLRGMKKLLNLTGGKAVQAIGITGQMHTLVMLDKDGRSVRPAIMWNDTRTKEMIPLMKNRIVHFQNGEYLAQTISTGSPAAGLYWMHENEPANFKRISKFLIGPDYLVYRLTGKYTTDYCEASTSCLFDLSKQKWSDEMRNLIGITEDMYPEIGGSAECAGVIKAEYAHQLGLNDDVTVLIGTGDNPATAVSTGCLGMGYPVISLGTSGVFMMPFRENRKLEKGKVILFSFDGNEYDYLVQGVVQSNGSTIDWWVKTIMGMEDFSQIDQLVSPDRLKYSRLLFYPHLMGEKTIYADPNLHGAFINIGMENDRGDMLCAVIEGLCMSFRELAEEMNLPLTESVKVVGGGSRSRTWMQIMANTLGIKIEQMDGTISPAFGIALLAAYNRGCISSREKISDGTMNIKQTFLPDPSMKECVEEKYKHYLRICQGLSYINGDWCEDIG